MCGALFRMKNEVNLHTEMFHTRMKCSQCDYVSYGLRNLQDHTQIVHNENLSLSLPRILEEMTKLQDVIAQ